MLSKLDFIIQVTPILCSGLRSRIEHDFIVAHFFFPILIGLNV